MDGWQDIHSLSILQFPIAYFFENIRPHMTSIFTLTNKSYIFFYSSWCPFVIWYMSTRQKVNNQDSIDFTIGLIMLARKYVVSKLSFSDDHRKK